MDFTSLALIGGLAAAGAAVVSTGAAELPSAESFFDLKAKSLQGKEVDFAQYEGKVVLVVNVASECGFTPQYRGLQALYSELSDRGFVILGFPSNEFGAQEPGTAEQIATFCKRNFGVTFPMFRKSVVKPGPEQSPVYRFLTAAGDVPSWNFCKYLIGKDGKLKAFYQSKVAPEDKALRAAIAAELAR